MDLFLGFDLGTSDTKGTVTDADLHVLFESSTRVPLVTPSRMDLDALYGSFVDVAQDLRRQAGEQWSDLRGVGVIGQGDGLWPLDHDKKPLCPSYMWNDSASGELGMERIDEISRLSSENNANPLNAGSFPVIAAWLKQCHPDVWEAMGYQIHTNDWINYKLTGVLGTDISQASSCCFDFRKKEYSQSFMDAVGIPEVMEKLLPYRKCTDIIGEVTKEASDETGIPAGLPVIAGTMDGIGVGIGSGIVRPDQAMIGVGTTMFFSSSMDESNCVYGQYYSTMAPSANGYHIRASQATLNGAQTLRWITDRFAPGKNYDEIDDTIRSVGPLSGGLMFQPYIFGERAPFSNAYATGSFMGLTYEHTDKEMLRAGYEGVVMSVRDCAEQLSEPSDIVLSGGVSSSPVFCQIMSDVLGKPLFKSLLKQSGTVGVIKLLQTALGRKKSIADFPPVEGILYEPDLDVHEKYDAWYGEFRRKRDEMRSFWTFRNSHKERLERRD